MMVGFDPVTILLVEDDIADQKLIKRSLSDQRIANRLQVTDSGEKAFDYLHNEAENEKRPALILLDLNMPGMGGKEFLRRIKKDEELKDIPVVILTTSDNETDIIDSYKLQASGYVKKPVTFDEFRISMEQLEEYWFVLCKRPNVAS